MRVLVVGSRGQLGTDLVATLSDRHEVLGVDLGDIDITVQSSVDDVFAGFSPESVVNCAAWTAVDAAEEQEALALAVNGAGPRHLAVACARSGAWLTHLSTDYVFDGTATSPYREDAMPAPRSAYGRTKLAGEQAVQALLPDSHYLVRTAWLYGLHGSNFVRTMLALEQQRDTVSVVDDQRGQPTYASDLAAHLAMLVDRRPSAGTFHATSSGECTWFEFARAIFEHAGADPERVLPTSSAQFVRPAPRPAYSVLGHSRWVEEGLPVMRPWQDALDAAFAAGITPA
jgi:dTDP-4-dehydrorhamnose reductase